MRNVFLYFIWVVTACQNSNSLELSSETGQSANNELSLEYILDYYKDDSLKQQAAIFLISHMHLHGTYSSVEKEVYDSVLFNCLSKIPDSTVNKISFTNPLVNKIIDSLDFVYGELKTLPLQEEKDGDNISTEFFTKHIDLAFASWKSKEFTRNYNFSQFCEYILPYRVADEELADWRTPMAERFGGLMNTSDSSLSIEKACSLINSRLRLSANQGFSQYPIAQSLENMEKSRIGTCQDQVNLALFAMRAQGLAVAHDFTPMYANYHSGHSWNALINPKEGSQDFMGTFRSIGQHYLWWKAAKVYRQTYSSQSFFPYEQVALTSIPYFFRKKNLLDVTDEYFPTTDITIEIPESYIESEKVAYLCTFADREWYPIHWSAINSDQSVIFDDMGRGHQSEDTVLNPVADDLLYFSQIDDGKGIVYTPMIFKRGELYSIGHALILDMEGNVMPLVPDTTNRQTVILTRKYPETLRKIQWRKRLVGGIFQAANKADFSDAQTILTITNTPDENFEKEKASIQKKFRYVRFMMNNDTISSVAEVAFYDESGKVLAGEVSYKGDFSMEGQAIQAADSNPLTFAENISPNSCIIWDFQYPTLIKDIAYLARNDGNAIQPGDRYELLYWDHQWVSLGKAKADTTFLVFSEVPSDALYWLKNLDRGKEERIFTYVDKKQIWW